ncbi:zinc transporter ZIP10 isoform X2 [Esox lucius]|uniref:zinc transporter ZIP10 isoform X2 n=1 Tax=Esox lucius TaxID=8010 RepID=UPI001476EEF4|nr:zinc transporter ZIP10 isoform X2 [Esox lucius]
MGSHSGETMRVHVHTTFCFLCVLTFLFHQCSHCHGDGHHHNHGHHDLSHGGAGNHDGHEHAHNDLQISQDPYTGGGQRLGGGSGQVLAQEQHFYIQELFQRHGHRDQLDFRGFQSLLVSLGLGVVKVVGMEHDDHDHVAHLDLLEVQEGLHSHLPTHEGPGHGHGHQHPRGKSHLHPHHPHTEPGPTHSTCHHLATGVSPTDDGGSLELDHNHDLDLSLVKDDNLDHDHEHIHIHDHDHKHDHEMEHKHEQLNQDDHSNKTHHDHDHSHDTDHKPHTPHHPSQNSTDNADSPSAHQGEPPTALSQALKVQPMAKATGSAADPMDKNSAPTTATTDSKRMRTRKPKGSKGLRPRNSHEHGHGPAPKAKRAVAPVNPTLQVPALPGHPEGKTHKHEECLNLTQLLNHYGLSPDSRISPNQFTYLCPALLYQIDSRACIRHYHQVDVEQAALETANSAWVWMWGFVSITIISLLSLLGVILVPILNQGCFKFLLTFLVALAVGTLSGDALLHLLPHSQGEHDHGHGESGNSSDTEEVDMLTAFDGVWKGLTALAGIYLLFIIEHCLGMFKHYKDAGGTFCRRKRKGEEAKIGRKLSDHKLNRRSDADWLHLKPLTEGSDSTAISCDNGHNDTQLSELQPLDSSSNNTPLASADSGSDSIAKENGRRPKKHRHGHSHGGHLNGGGHGHSHGGNCHSDQEMKDAGIASIAWMVIMGDGMHNFSDGLAIGAAFSANITGGISTSVAVFCHELPHELGDFAVLLKAGMSVKQAIVYNLLSALMAYVGMVIGTAVGQYTHNVTSWIFAVTAGMFLYVALVDMLPEMLHGDSEEHKRCQLGHFVLQNLGLLTGFSIMLLIAIFEDQIVFDFGF